MPSLFMYANSMIPELIYAKSFTLPRFQPLVKDETPVKFNHLSPPPHTQESSIY